MKTETVINKTKVAIRERQGKAMRLARNYINAPVNSKKAKDILAKMKAMKKEKAKLAQLLGKMEKRKKTMKAMKWKRDKTLIENIETNIK